MEDELISFLLAFLSLWSKKGTIRYTANRNLTAAITLRFYSQWNPNCESSFVEDWLDESAGEKVLISDRLFRALFFVELRNTSLSYRTHCVRYRSALYIDRRATETVTGTVTKLSCQINVILDVLLTIYSNNYHQPTDMLTDNCAQTKLKDWTGNRETSYLPWELSELTF